MSLDKLDLINARHPSANLVTGGQPTPEQLRAGVEAGLRYVIDLRPASEDAGFDEPALLSSLGVDYQRVPVAGPAGLTRDAVQALDSALARTGGAPTMIHCASGNRVGALMALRAHWLHGRSVEEALAVGKAHGLMAMEAAVRSILGA